MRKKNEQYVQSKQWERINISPSKNKLNRTFKILTGSPS